MTKQRWAPIVASGIVAVIGIEPDAVWWVWGDIQIRSGQFLSFVVVALAVGDRVLARPSPRRPITVPVLVIVHAGCILASWATAELFRPSVNATTFRLVLAPTLGLALWSLMRDRTDRRVLAAALVAVGAVAAGIGILAAVGGGEWWFTDQLRGSPTELGPHQRLTRPFNHANVAAMVLAPLAVLSLALVGRGRWWWVASALVTIATVYTYSRMAPVALAVGALFAAAVGVRRRAVGLLLALLAAAFAVALVVSPGWSSRLTSPGDQAWFGVAVAVPEFDTDDGRARIEIENRSDVTWRAEGAERVEVSLRWRTANNQRQYLDERFPLPNDLDPGDRVEVAVVSAAAGLVQRGERLVIVDVVRDREAFFGETTGGAATLLVDLSNGVPFARATAAARPVPQMARSDLWRAAWELVRDEPLWGVGTGNFRLLYGYELGLDDFRRSSHAHSLYLEPAASSGMPAAMALAAAISVAVVATWRSRPLSQVDAAFAGALVTMAVHGLVDWPLIFTASGALFFTLLGVTAAGAAEGDFGGEAGTVIRADAEGGDR